MLQKVCRQPEQCRSYGALLFGCLGHYKHPTPKEFLKRCPPSFPRMVKHLDWIWPKFVVISAFLRYLRFLSCLLFLPSFVGVADACFQGSGWH